MSKASGNDQLREQLDALGNSLRAFDDPLVEELPGLRLMAETLKEREEHIRNTIRKNETCSLELVLSGASVESEAVPTALLSRLLQALDAAFTAAALRHVSGWSPPPGADEMAAAVALHIADLDVDRDVTLLLTRRPGPLAAQPADTDLGIPLFEVATVAVSDQLVAFTNGDAAELPSELHEPIADIAQVLVDSSVVLRWSLDPFLLDPVEVEITQVHARRLLEHCRS